MLLCHKNNETLSFMTIWMTTLCQVKTPETQSVSTHGIVDVWNPQGLFYRSKQKTSGNKRLWNLEKMDGELTARFIFRMNKLKSAIP